MAVQPLAEISNPIVDFIPKILTPSPINNNFKYSNNLQYPLDMENTYQIDRFNPNFIEESTPHFINNDVLEDITPVGRKYFFETETVTTEGIDKDENIGESLIKITKRNKNHGISNNKKNIYQVESQNQIFSLKDISNQGHFEFKNGSDQQEENKKYSKFKKVNISKKDNKQITKENTSKNINPSNSSKNKDSQATKDNNNPIKGTNLKKNLRV